jgi:hypothetical protein
MITPMTILRRRQDRKKKDEFNRQLNFFVMIQNERQKAVWEYQDQLAAMGYDFINPPKVS